MWVNDMDSKTYWTNRIDNIFKDLDKTDIKTVQTIMSSYDEALKLIDNDIQRQLELHSTDGAINKDLLVEKALKSDIDKYVKAATDWRNGKDRSEEARKFLNDQLYTQNMKTFILMQQDLELSLAKATEKSVSELSDYLTNATEKAYSSIAAGDDLTQGEARQIANTNWSGTEFSSRIWTDVKKLSNKLQQHMLIAAIRGENPRVTAARMQKQLQGGTRYMYERLVRTETTRTANAGILKRYKDMGLSRYEFAAVMDRRTSQVCRGLDGMEYKISEYEIGVNAPPMHPNCRSRILPTAREISKDYSDEEQAPNSESLSKESIAKMVADTKIAPDNLKDIIKLGDSFNKFYGISDLVDNGNGAEIAKAISNFRKVGTKLDKKVFAKGSKVSYKEDFSEVVKFLPTDWGNVLSKNNKQLYIVKDTKRGYFYPGIVKRNNRNGSLYNVKGLDLKSGVTIASTDINTKKTIQHEFGHLYDNFNKDILAVEKAWVESRTKGEKEMKLDDIFKGWGYRKNEVTKKDNFVTPYIGKNYKDSSEVLSIGLEGIFYNSKFAKDSKTYNTITADQEYLNLILAILLKG